MAEHGRWGRRWIGGLLVAVAALGAGTTAWGQSVGRSGAQAGPWMGVRPPRTTAGLAPDSIRRTIGRNQAAIVQCYQQLLSAEPAAHGVLSVRIEVIAGGFGQVSRVRFSRRNATFEGCVQGVLGQITWPAPRNAPSTEVDLQLDFAPSTPPPSAASRR